MSYCDEQIINNNRKKNILVERGNNRKKPDLSIIKHVFHMRYTANCVVHHLPLHSYNTHQITGTQHELIQTYFDMLPVGKKL